MHWNYRVMRREGAEDDFGVHEVYYVDDMVTSWTKEPVAVAGESVEELLEILGFMKEACEKPVLEENLK